MVGVVLTAAVILEVIGWPESSGFSEPPDIADNVSSFSSLPAHLKFNTLSSDNYHRTHPSDLTSSLVLFASPSFFFLSFFFDGFLSRRLRRKPETAQRNKAYISVSYCAFYMCVIIIIINQQHQQHIYLLKHWVSVCKGQPPSSFVSSMWVRECVCKRSVNKYKKAPT